MAAATRIDLGDVSFVIPVRIDSRHRRQNLEVVVDYLLHHADCDLSVGEMAPSPEMEHLADRCRYAAFPDSGPHMHKTRLVNLLIRRAERPIVCIYDADVVCEVEQLELSAELIRTGDSDAVFPYDGLFVDVAREHIERLHRELSVDFLGEIEHPVRQSDGYGGAVFFRRDTFVEIGMMNERFRSWGFEDTELLARALKLGVEPARVSGPLFHLEHDRGPDSSPDNPFQKANREEFLRVRNMDPGALRDYIATWEWCR